MKISVWSTPPIFNSFYDLFHPPPQFWYTVRNIATFNISTRHIFVLLKLATLKNTNKGLYNSKKWSLFERRQSKIYFGFTFSFLLVTQIFRKASLEGPSTAASSYIVNISAKNRNSDAYEFFPKDQNSFEFLSQKKHNSYFRKPPNIKLTACSSI